MTNKFDPFGNLERNLALLFKSGQWGLKAGRYTRAKAVRHSVEKLFGPEVADAVEAAIRSGRDPAPILERARRDLDARHERERQLATPPTLHGSARWPTSEDLQRYLRPKTAFDDPRSILLGSFNDEGQPKPAGYVHWDGDGHLLTIAPTRTGKGLTTIIPNLLRYRGSCVVLDPKGELFEATSQWRSTLGPVYRIAPLDRGSGKPVHRFDPVSRVRRESDARAIAQQMFPRDPKASAFFADDAVGFMTAAIMYVRHKAPPTRRTLSTACQLASLKGASLLKVAKDMEAFPPSADAARSVLEKNAQYGLKVLQDTLTSKLYEWNDPDIQSSLDANEVRFESLKDQTAMRRMGLARSFQNALVWYLGFSQTLQRWGRWLLTWLSELFVLRLSRKREYWADAIGAALTSKEQMISALEKLHAVKELEPFERTNARLMFRGLAGHSWFSTHPTMMQRRAALENETYLRRIPVIRAESPAPLEAPAVLPKAEDIAYAKR